MTLRRLLKSLVIPVFLLVGLHASAQETILVSGKVSDSKDGSPLVGVSINVKGTTTGTTSDATGKFSLKAKPGATIVFTYVGFVNHEVVVSTPEMNVALTAVQSSLNEVVVIGYGTARKKDLTGAVANVTSKDFQKGNITTPEQLIAGKVAGVSIISNSGRPGAGSTIRIRGGSSLVASNDPLIVVDGVPLDYNGISGAANPLSFINSNDIESFTVLKDASAAAIYGSRANNGVIIITTKKGKGGALRFTFNTNNSVSQLFNKVDVLSSSEVKSLVNQYGSPKQMSQLGNSNTDWQDQIYQTGFGTDNNLTMMGGLKNLPYRLTVGYMNQTGVLKTDNLQKTSVSLALNPTFLDNHLKVDLNLKGSAQNTRFADEGAIGTAVGFDPTQPIYSNDKRYGGYFEWREADGSLIQNRANNPLGMLEQRWDEQNPKRLISNLQLDYKFHFLPELRANMNAALDYSNSEGHVYVPDSAASNYTSGGLYRQSKQEKKNSVFDFYLNYAKDIKSINSRVDVTAGYSYNNFWTKNYFYRDLNAKHDTIAGTKNVNFPYDIPENTLMSYWARLIYNYGSRYFLTASLRRDGSSRFSKENRWGTFPSLGLAWSIKNEDFMKSNKTFSELKLRLGYGLTGQQDGIGNYDYLSRYGLGAQTAAYQMGSQYVTYYGPFGFNSNLKWEELTSYNAAIDFGFLNNRINGSIDFYLRKSQDLLNNVPQAAATNFSSYVLANVGSLENKGVEFTLNTNPVRNTNFNLNVNFNVAYNDNQITKLNYNPNDPTGLPTGTAAAVNGFVQIHQVGYSRNTFYMYQQIYDENGKPIEGLFEDRNRDGILNDKDKNYVHSAVADWIGGFNADFTYKKWSGGFVMRGSLNNYVYNNVFANRGRLNNVTGAYIIGNASSNYLTTQFKGENDKQTLSDYYLENASFLRMDNIFAGYNFGKVLRDAATLRLNASVQNVFVITKYQGLDPEIANGIDQNIYPRPTVFSLAINLDF